MSMSQFDGQYPGMGAFSGFLDTGAVVKSATPSTFTATLALDNGIQPAYIRGKAYLNLYSLNASAVIGQVDFTVIDDAGSPITESVDSIPASVVGTAGQGASYVTEFFISGNNAAKIKSVVAVVATTGNNNYTGDLRVLVGF